MADVIALLLIASWAGAAAPDPVKIQQLYDKAFQLYKASEYGQALQTWNEILRLDPEQKSAREMIQNAREEIRRKNRQKLDVLYGHVDQGDYQKALVTLQTLIEEDESFPRYKNLQSALEGVSAIVPRAPARTKTWRMGVTGLGGLVGRREDLRLAHNGLRYALELDPKDEKLRRLLEWLLSRHPELASADQVTPGMGLIQYKNFLALNHIYDGKYHLAVDTANEVLALEPQDLTALKRLGTAYFSLGQKEKAREAWARALRLAPEDAQLKKFLQKL